MPCSLHHRRNATLKSLCCPPNFQGRPGAVELAQAYRGRIFIAEHGSWNRSKKIGYRIMMVEFENGETLSYEPFAEGWLQGESVSGRPVDLMVLGDGSMLVSDDLSGKIYRISYSEPDD